MSLGKSAVPSSLNKSLILFISFASPLPWVLPALILHFVIVKLPNVQFLGTNEKHLKTYTKATIRRDGKLWTEDGMEIWCCHGQFYHEKWRNIQLANRRRCIAGRLDSSEKSYNDGVGALNVLTNVFRQMLDHKIIIEKLDYRHS